LRLGTAVRLGDQQLGPVDSRQRRKRLELVAISHKPRSEPVLLAISMTGNTWMLSSQLHYLPLTPAFFSLLVGALFVVVVLIQLGILRYAYISIGVRARSALWLLFGSLIGSYINIPIAQLPAEQVLSGREVMYFGMHYVVPLAVDWPGTVIAVNVGGALIPGLTSIYLLAKNRLWGVGIVATACVTAVCHLLADPVPGVGIALPILVPALSAAFIALLLSRAYVAPLAYIGGSLGTLIGADLLNLDKLQGLGAPIASIGGAGTFDGVFLTGIVAVLIASLSRQRRDEPSAEPQATKIQ
jgi:uncharacterized membrane protein